MTSSELRRVLDEVSKRSINEPAHFKAQQVYTRRTLTVVKLNN